MAFVQHVENVKTRFQTGRYASSSKAAAHRQRLAGGAHPGHHCCPGQEAKPNKFDNHSQPPTQDPSPGSLGVLRMNRSPVWDRKPRFASSPCSRLLPLSAVFTVTNTSDSGAGSFRQALLDANAAVGSRRYRVQHSGVRACTSLRRPRPIFQNITSPVLIDGYTQPGSRAEHECAERRHQRRAAD